MTHDHSAAVLNVISDLQPIGFRSIMNALASRQIAISVHMLDITLQRLRRQGRVRYQRADNGARPGWVTEKGDDWQ